MLAVRSFGFFTNGVFMNSTLRTKETGILTERLNELTEKLKQAYHELDTFVYKVSHDLRSPLSALDGYATILLEEYKDTLSEEAQQFLTRIKFNVREIAGMVDELLELAHFDRIVSKKEQVNIAEIVKKVKMELATVLDEKKIHLQVQENLPTIPASNEAIFRVFVNLVNNSVKFADTKKDRTIIKIGCQTEQGSLSQFSVQDNGIGLGEGDQGKVFEIFHKVYIDEEDKNIPLNGLVLSKKIVEYYGGKIWVESEKGSGTTFYFTLPKRG